MGGEGRMCQTGCKIRQRGPNYEHHWKEQIEQHQHNALERPHSTDGS
jgi:hypothetical protein